MQEIATFFNLPTSQLLSCLVFKMPQNSENVLLAFTLTTIIYEGEIAAYPNTPEAIKTEKLKKFNQLSY